MRNLCEYYNLGLLPVPSCDKIKVLKLFSSHLADRIKGKIQDAEK